MAWTSFALKMSLTSEAIALSVNLFHLLQPVLTGHSSKASPTMTYLIRETLRARAQHLHVPASCHVCQIRSPVQ